MAAVNKEKTLFTCGEATENFVLRQVLSDSPLGFIQKDFSNVQNTIDCILFINE